MKNLLKISALTAVLVASATYASADVVNFVSNSGTVSYGGFTPVIGDTIPSPGVGATFNLPTNGVWAGPIGTSQWVSFNAGTFPNGPTIAPNGDYYYGSSFTMAAGDTSFVGAMSVLADDTTSVWLNGVELQHTGFIGGDGKCSDNIPNCTTVATFNLTGVHAGLNVLLFTVEQTGLSATGLDFSGTVTGSAAPAVPEPSTLLMLGTGLLGSAGAMFRRMRRS